MDERDALLAAIHENAEDDTVRLVFADWLQEQGEEARAEFIRVQVGLARAATGDPEAEDRRRLEKELLAAYGTAWSGGYPVNAMVFRRGFPDTLNLARVEIGDEGAVVLATSPYLAGLTALDLNNSRIGVEGAVALAASPYLANLTTLKLSYNQIRNAGVKALARSQYLANLTALDLVYNGIDDAGAAALAVAPSLANLTTLLLRRDWNGGMCAEMMHDWHVTNMKLVENQITDGFWGTLKARFGDRVKR